MGRRFGPPKNFALRPVFDKVIVTCLGAVYCISNIAQNTVPIHSVLDSNRGVQLRFSRVYSNNEKKPVVLAAISGLQAHNAHRGQLEYRKLYEVAYGRYYY